MDEAAARCYLAENNNYFRLRSYRTGFAKVDAGPREGLYANLDFAMLVDLSIIDMRLRYEMLPMTLDIEHFVKVKLLGVMEQHGEDGYAIVRDFIVANEDKPKKGVNAVKQEIDRGSSSPYTAGLIAAYADYNLPAWAFIEVIAFGSFCYFYKFCAERYEDDEMIKEFYILQGVRSLRNAAAHNNCIINDLSSKNAYFQAPLAVFQAVSDVKGIGAKQRKAKLSNARIQQITTTLYAHMRLASVGVHNSRAKNLKLFIDRMNRNKSYYVGNSQIISGFEYLTKVVNAWFALEETPTKID